MTTSQKGTFSGLPLNQTTFFYFWFVWDRNNGPCSSIAFFQARIYCFDDIVHVSIVYVIVYLDWFMEEVDKLNFNFSIWFANFLPSSLFVCLRLEMTNLADLLETSTKIWAETIQMDRNLLWNFAFFKLILATRGFVWLLLMVFC